ncbi:MAG: hypothetical protein ACKO2G_01915 [Verrucomicrobiales bacterium]
MISNSITCLHGHRKSLAGNILAVFLMLFASAGAHDHYAAGIDDLNANGKPDAGEPLKLVGTTGESKIRHLLARPVGQRCGGHYMLDEFPRTLHPFESFALTALSDGQFGDKSPNHAHTGTWIWVEIMAVSGPEGGIFGFWEAGQQGQGNSPTHAMIANQPTGNPAFVLSEGIDDEEEDPSGHIHGRAWSANKPGEYALTFRLIDRSTTGPNDGPWHTPSRSYTYQFKTGPAFQPVITRAPGGHVVLIWPARIGIFENYETGLPFGINRALSPAGPWTKIGEIIAGTTDTVSFTDTSPPPGAAFYRLDFQWSPP